MTKADMTALITQLIDHYSAALIRCGIKVENYRQDFETRTVPQLKEGLNWLKARQELIDEYNKVRSLRSEEVWATYEAMGSEDLREVIMLRDVTRKVKASFINRPAALRKAKDGSKCKRSGESA